MKNVKGSILRVIAVFAMAVCVGWIWTKSSATTPYAPEKQHVQIPSSPSEDRSAPPSTSQSSSHSKLSPSWVFCTLLGIAGILQILRPRTA